MFLNTLGSATELVLLLVTSLRELDAPAAPQSALWRQEVLSSHFNHVVLPRGALQGLDIHTVTTLWVRFVLLSPFSPIRREETVRAYLAIY